MSKLTGKIAVVTGASKGIGAGIAKALGREGATVVVNYASDKAGAEKTAAEIAKAGGKAVVVGGSVAETAGRDGLFAEVKKQFGKLDILVNNAGVFGPTPLESLDEAEFDRQYNTNVKGLLFTTKAAFPLFGPEGGSIINVSSLVATRNFPQMSIYASTKGAVDTITRVLSAELGPKKIRVNSLSPGMVVTEGAHLGRLYRRRLREDGRCGHAARARGSARRHRGCRGVSRLGRRALGDRHDPGSRRWQPLTQSVRGWRTTARLDSFRPDRWSRPVPEAASL